MYYLTLASLNYCKPCHQVFIFIFFWNVYISKEVVEWNIINDILGMTANGANALSLANLAYTVSSHSVTVKLQLKLGSVLVLIMFF